METEIWKEVKAYEGLYEVSNFGRVRSLDREVPIWGTFKKIKGKILKAHQMESKRMQVQLSKDRIRIHYYVHRLVGIAFIPNPDNLPQINHKNLDPTDNHVSNLEWITGQANVHHFRETRTKTGIIGITFERQTGKYRVRMKIGKGTKFIGRSNTLQGAKELMNSVVFVGSGTEP